jgi:hypothetical protein
MRVAVKTRPRSGGGAMQKVGWVATALGALSLLAILAMVVSSVPELRRYVKMETM